MRKFSIPTTAFTIRMHTSKRYYLSYVPTPHVSSLDVYSNDVTTSTDVAPFSFTSQTISSDNIMNGIDTTMASTSANDVLSTQDIVVGTIIAFILAFGYSFLNGQSSSTSFVSWPSQSNNENDTLEEEAIDISMETNDVGLDSDEKTKTFNADSWKEMSREENYILYNTKIRQKSNPDYNKKESRMQNDNDDMKKKENKLILVALLILFVPIFSVEFFFALSRQFICEMGMGGDECQKFCSPITY